MFPHFQYRAFQYVITHCKIFSWKSEVVNLQRPNQSAKILHRLKCNCRLKTSAASILHETISQVILTKFFQNTSERAYELYLIDFVFRFEFTYFTNFLFLAVYANMVHCNKLGTLHLHEMWFILYRKKQTFLHNYQN